MKSRPLALFLLVLLLSTSIVATPFLPLGVEAQEAEGNPSTITEIWAPPIVFEENSSYIRLNFTMFTIDFAKGTAGYNVIYDGNGEIVVHNERQVLQYWTGNKWKQRGIPFDLSWIKVSNHQYNVTRHYKDYLGTFYNVTFIVRSDTQVKSVIELESGQTDEYGLLWQLSGIVHEDWTKQDNRFVFGDEDADHGWIGFDWEDVYQSFGDITESSVETSANGKKANIFFDIGVVEAGQRIIVDPATVGTSTKEIAVTFGFQRKGFYAQGLFWGFYSDGTNAGWEFSNDGTTWTGAFTSIGACGYGHFFSVWFDGTHVHYVRTDHTGTYDTFYRRGTPVNDGTINWSAVEQTVHSGINTDEYEFPCISVDTNGYAWIGVYHDQPDGDDFPVVLKNANNDGTWALDFAYELSAVDDSGWRVGLVPLTGGKVYVIYCRGGQPPLGKLYDAGWGAEENDLAGCSIEAGYLFSAVAYGDNVHFAYNRDITYQIRHNERVWGVGWDAADVLVEDAVGSLCSPVLSVDPSTGDLYCFWTRTTTDHVYYKQYSGGAWGGLVDWIDESTDDIETDYLISGFYMDYGGYIGLLYVTKLASPHNVRFAFLQTLTNESPNSPSLTSPTNGTKYNISESVSFTWTFDDPDDGDTQGAYQIQLDNNSDFSSPEVDSGKVYSSSESTNRNLPSSVDVYYWRVKTWDDSDEEGPWSAVRYVIADCFEIVSVAFDVNRVNIGTSAEVRYVLRYDYDDVPFTGSDGSIVGYSWDETNSWWNKSVTAPSSPGYDIYDENDLGAITDSNYGLTALEDDAGANLIGDDLNVTDFWASTYLLLTGDNITLYAKFESLYDFHVCDGDDSITIEDLPFIYDPIEDWFYASVGKNEFGTYYFDTLNLICENTYNITSGQMDFNISVTWFDYTVDLFGLYYENGTYAGNVSLTVYFENSIEIFTLEENASKNYEEAPQMYTWPLWGGASRTLYPIGLNETYYIFVPDGEYSAYSFTVKDFTGVIGNADSYLEILLNVNGTERLIERDLIWDTANPVVAILEKDNRYKLQIRDGNGEVHVFDYFLPIIGVTPDLIIDDIPFSDQVHYVGEYVLVEALRPAYEHIRINYKDERGETTSIFVEICLLNGTQIWNTTSTESVAQFNWYDAVNTTHYLVNLVAQHERVEEVWYSLALAGCPSDFDDPPSLTVFGKAGQYLIPVGILVVCLAFGDAGTGKMATTLMVCLAYMLKFMGWLPVPVMAIHLGMFITIAWWLQGRI